MSVSSIKSMTLAEKARDTHRGLDLLASGYSSQVRSGAVLSPFYQLKHCSDFVGLQTVKRASRDIKLSLATMKFVVYNLMPNECDFNIFNGTTLITNDFVQPNISEPVSYDAMIAVTAPLIVAKMTGAPNNYTMTAADIIWPEPTLPPTPASYQTIVSQTGTAAPAVSGGFTPVNTYSGSPTFTWARTGTGVYTLTASSAIFNTSGKTGVFITPPQNLNGSFKAVVTSSTVITITTAVQSLAVLGLLGFTATPTDAMLTNTMIYIQTYS